LRDMFRRCEIWQAHVHPGCWPDCDMLPLGRIGMGWRQGRMTNFTREEQRTMMTLWCIFRAPLMMGGEMRENDEWTLGLLTNGRVLRLLGHSHGARQVSRDAAHAAWHSFDEDGSEYLALFNLSDEPAEVGVSDEVWTKTPVSICELWGRDELVKDCTSAVIPAHGAVLIRAEFI
ncbi:MAG: alpha-galactosidase, partial [Eubacteriales bacterium]|nr:alpha-galactosidase [Eubacteriales bacterium]